VGATSPTKVVRVIARLNVGGPSIQAITLTRTLEPFGYATTLVRGTEGDREGSMDDLARSLGVTPVLVPSLRRDPGAHDLRALLALIAIIRRERPRIVHTHAAKAGTLGRLAAIAASWGRAEKPIVVHTFHGHSLTGYFSDRRSAAYRRIEQLLARRTDALIAVSTEVRDELVALGVAAADRFAVIRLGFDLAAFTVDGAARDSARRAIRAELGIHPDAIVVTLVARLVPIKRVDRFLAAARECAEVEGAHFLIVGDGELRERLRSSAAAKTLGARVTWTGFRTDIPEICFASDVAVLCSDNEGTPVSLIEAAAAGLPTISTRVGGASAVVRNGETGFLVARDEGKALASAMRRLITDVGLRETLGRAGRDHALGSFSLERLNREVASLYERLATEAKSARRVSHRVRNRRL
jgi:glycosyltransferase involved in cell wall biosynthesis